MTRRALVVRVFALHGLLLLGCGDDVHKATSATIGTDGITPDLPPATPLCGVQEFTPPDGPGQRYGCDVSVEGHIEFTVCHEFDPTEGGVDWNCTPVPTVSVQNVLIDAAETVGADGILEFPADDPTGGPQVQVCCEDSIEGGTNGEEIGDNACLVDCAHAACLRALEQFQALVDTPPITFCPDPMSFPVAHEKCAKNVTQSVTYWRDMLKQKFDLCVSTVASGDPDKTFELGSPGCVKNLGALKGGCLAHTVLDLKCTAADIDLLTGVGGCTQAKNQPPENTAEPLTCDVWGSGIYVSSESFHTSFTDATLTASYHRCVDPECTFTLDNMNFNIDPIVWGTADIENIQVELLHPATGTSDGEDFEFAAGSIWVRITGDLVDGGTTPFDVVAGNVLPSTGSFDSSSINFEAYFEAGGYAFVATVDDTSCVAP